MLPGLPRAYQHTLCRAWLCRAMHVRVVGEAPVGQPESAAAHWLPGASPRVTHSAPMAWALRARAPVAAGSLPRATRSAPKAGALRARAPTCAPRVTAHVVSLGGVGISMTSCAARCSRGSVQGVLRAPAEGEGGVAHREDLAATASATLERSAGTVAHGKRAARERRRRRSKVSHAAGAPATRRRRAVGRRVRVPRAFKRPAKTFGGGGGGGAHTNSELPQAGFPCDRGKYIYESVLHQRGVVTALQAGGVNSQHGTANDTASRLGLFNYVI